jgi:hypothetical protein
MGTKVSEELVAFVFRVVRTEVLRNIYRKILGESFENLWEDMMRL